MVRNCKECGISYETTNKKKIFCSKACAMRSCHRKHNIRGVKNPCKYVKEVNCTDGNCAICGWNPQVEKQRKAVLGCG